MLRISGRSRWLSFSRPWVLTISSTASRSSWSVVSRCWPSTTCRMFRSPTGALCWATTIAPMKWGETFGSAARIRSARASMSFQSGSHWSSSVQTYGRWYMGIWNRTSPVKILVRERISACISWSPPVARSATRPASRRGGRPRRRWACWDRSVQDVAARRRRSGGGSPPTWHRRSPATVQRGRCG